MPARAGQRLGLRAPAGYLDRVRRTGEHGALMAPRPITRTNLADPDLFHHASRPCPKRTVATRARSSAVSLPSAVTARRTAFSRSLMPTPPRGTTLAPAVCRHG